MDLEANINNIDIDVDITSGLNVESSMSSAIEVSNSNVGGPKGNRGEQGDRGEKGDPGDRGEKGETGVPGPANTLSIGTVAKGDEAQASITGEAPNQTLNLVLPKGDKGDTGKTGPAATITVGAVATLPAGSDATVSNAGTESAAVLNFGIPKGVDGVQPVLQGMSWGTYHDRI